MSSKPVSLNLDLETITFLDAEAARQGRSRSALANRIILAAATVASVDNAAREELGRMLKGSPARGTDLAGGFKPDPKP